MKVLNHKSMRVLNHKSMKVLNHKGMALLVTLALISVLMTAALELAKSAGYSSEMEKRTSDRLQAEEIAKSGIELAMFILTRDAEQNDIDSLQETWANPEILASAVQLLGFEDGVLDIVITDELGKIQVNSLLTYFPGAILNNDQSALWERFLNIILSSDKSVDLRDPSEMINSLKDWLDSGDHDAISGLSGAESDYYEALDPPIVCSNAPFNTVEEMFMVKGIPQHFTNLSDKIFNLDKISNFNKIANFDKTANADKTANQNLDPSKIFTVYGIDSTKKEGKTLSYSGTININTADVMVLAAMLPAGMEDQASELADFRMNKGQNGNFFTNALDSGWYKRVIGLSPKEAQEFEKIIRYSSDFFRVDATAQFNDTHVSLAGFIKREKRTKSGKWGCTIIQLTENVNYE